MQEWPRQGRLTRQQRQLQVSEEQAKEEADIVKATFFGETGQKCLALLKALFYNRSPMVPGDPYLTHYNVGQQEVIAFILEAIERSGE